MKKMLLIIGFLVLSQISNSQSKKDTSLYNQFRDYVEWQKKLHQQTLDEMERDRYQLIYVDKIFIDRSKHRIYLYAGTEIGWGYESGIRWEIVIPKHKPKKIKKNERNTLQIK